MRPGMTGRNQPEAAIPNAKFWALSLQPFATV